MPVAVWPNWGLPVDAETCPSQVIETGKILKWENRDITFHPSEDVLPLWHTGRIKGKQRIFHQLLLIFEASETGPILLCVAFGCQCYCNTTLYHGRALKTQVIFSPSGRLTDRWSHYHRNSPHYSLFSPDSAYPASNSALICQTSPLAGTGYWFTGILCPGCIATIWGFQQWTSLESSHPITSLSS